MCVCDRCAVTNNIAWLKFIKRRPIGDDLINDEHSYVVWYDMVWYGMVWYSLPVPLGERARTAASSTDVNPSRFRSPKDR